MEQRRNQWNFEITDAGWIWTMLNADGAKESSNRAFQTLKQCVDDATQCGYVAWKAEAERRREHRLGVSSVLTRDTAK